MTKKLKLKFRLTLKLIEFLKKINIPKKRSYGEKDFQKILIVSNTGIGDTMWGTPALKMIRKKYPKSHLSVLTNSLSEQVFLNNPDLDETIYIPGRGGPPLIKRFRQLYKNQYDTILIFHTSYKWMILICYFLAPKKLIAFKHDAKMFEPLVTDVLEAKFNHPILQRLMIAKKIGVDEEEHQIQIYLTESEHKKASEFLSQFNFDEKKPIIGLQPGASDIFKCWPLKRFKELAKRLHNELQAQIVIFGNKGEIHLADEIGKEAPVITAAGQVPLRVSAALMKKMDVFVTNDTGPLHLAIAQKVPLIALFGPTPNHLCWPHLNNPIVRIISRLVPCITCVRRKCHLPFCLEQLEVKEVMGHLNDLLSMKEQKLALLN